MEQFLACQWKKSMLICSRIVSISSVSAFSKNLIGKTEKASVKNQLNKLTERPTLRWIIQCFQGIHALITL